MAALNHRQCIWHFEVPCPKLLGLSRIHKIWRTHVTCMMNLSIRLRLYRPQRLLQPLKDIHVFTASASTDYYSSVADTGGGAVADPGGGHNGPVPPPPPPPPPEGPAPTYTRTCTTMCTRTYANAAQRYSYGRNGLYVHNDTWVRPCMNMIAFIA